LFPSRFPPKTFDPSKLGFAPKALAPSKLGFVPRPLTPKRFGFWKPCRPVMLKTTFEQPFQFLGVKNYLKCDVLLVSVLIGSLGLFYQPIGAKCKCIGVQSLAQA